MVAAPPMPGFGAPGVPSADNVTFSFSPSEEFGPGTVTRAPQGAASTNPGGIVGGIIPTGPASRPATAAPPTTPAAGGKIVADPKRYVDKIDKLNLRTRAFYMELLMSHDKIPQLLTEFRNSPWPTRIYRVQMVAKENGTAPSVQLQGGAGPGMAGRPPGGGGFGGGRRRGRDEDEDEPIRQQQAAPVEVGPLADPKLSYVAIAGLITIYLPPNEDAAKAAFVGPETAPAAVDTLPGTTSAQPEAGNAPKEESGAAVEATKSIEPVGGGPPVSGPPSAGGSEAAAPTTPPATQ